jgi:anti-sigma B factor antagonist
VLVSLNDDALATGTPLRVVVDQARPVMRPIRTMGLDDVLAMYGTVDEAVAG